MNGNIDFGRNYSTTIIILLLNNAYSSRDSSKETLQDIVF